MDSWDPAVVNGLAKDRPVIVFDNTGVGKSGGATPDNVAQMASDVTHFITALGLEKVDLLDTDCGFIGRKSVHASCYEGFTAHRSPGRGRSTSAFSPMRAARKRRGRYL